MQPHWLKARVEKGVQCWLVPRGIPLAGNIAPRYSRSDWKTSSRVVDESESGKIELCELRSNPSRTRLIRRLAKRQLNTLSIYSERQQEEKRERERECKFPSDNVRDSSVHGTITPRLSTNDFSATPMKFSYLVPLYLSDFVRLFLSLAPIPSTIT